MSWLRAPSGRSWDCLGQERRLVAPLDPACPGARRIEEDLADPITVDAGIGDELGEDLARRHRAECERCREFGATNIEVETG